MKTKIYIIMVGMMLCGGNSCSAEAQSPEIVEIHLYDRRGCINDDITDLRIMPNAYGWEITLDKQYVPQSVFENVLHGAIPKPLVDEYTAKLGDAGFILLKDTYNGQRQSTADARGYFSITYKAGLKPEEKEVNYTVPEQCPAEFWKIFDLIRQLQDYAIASITSVKSDHPYTQREAVFLLGEAKGQKERAARVLRAYVLNQQADELIGELIELQKLDPKILAAKWRTNAESVKWCIAKALSNINNIK